MKVRKLPVEVEAVQWTGKNLDEIESFTSGAAHEARIWGLEIHTLEGSVWASVGDWIIRGVRGEFYPCKPDVFEQTYEVVAE